MRQAFIFSVISCCVLGNGIPQVSLYSEETPSAAVKEAQKPFTAFTGKIVKDKVRMRTQPSLDGQIIRELGKGDMVVVVNETDDFYTVQCPPDLKAYIFRTFVLDNQIEGNHVNVRSLPDLEAPIIAQLNTGDKIDGAISALNNKWFEISPPLSTKFYICKDYVEKLGDASLMATLTRRKEEANLLLEATERISLEEMQKPFPEINLERLSHNCQTLIKDYSDFSEQALKAKELLTKLQEEYLTKKIAYLELKASQKAEHFDAQIVSKTLVEQEKTDEKAEDLSSSLAVWLPQEKTLYEQWSEQEFARSVDDFYAEQRSEAITLQGLLESYKLPIKNRPGDYLLVNKSNNLPIAYLYSTKVDLQGIVGKEVTITAVERPNNFFAYPAYFVLAVE